MACCEIRYIRSIREAGVNVETTADRLRLARETFPEFAELLSENIIESLARQLDDGKLDAIVEGAEHQNAPGMFRDVLQLVVRASDDDRRRRRNQPAGTPTNPGRAAGGRAEPPVTTRTEPAAPPVGRDQRTGAPATSDRRQARGRQSDADRPAPDDGHQPSVTEPVRGPLASPEPEHPADPIDLAWFTGGVDSFAVIDGGELHAVEVPDGIRLSWVAPASERQAVYLIAGSASRPPDSLYGAQLLAATRAFSLTVPRDSGPHFTVFGYEGDSPEEAARGVGRPLGRASLLPEVRNLSASATASKVTVRWTRPAGVDRVRLSRSRPNEELSARFDPKLQLPVSGDVFEDLTATPGAAFVYRVQTFGPKSDIPSHGVEVSVTVPLVPRPVIDLRAETEMHDPDLWVTLRYSQPSAGRVMILQSAQRPREVSANRFFDLANLATLELGTQVDNVAVEISQTEREIPGIAFAITDGTTRYYTPVTLGGDTFVVGRPVEVHYVSPVHDIEVIDRVEYQIVRFAWPTGANEVAYAEMPPGTSEPDPTRWKRCHFDRYEELGGVRLVLPDTGARVFVRGLQALGTRTFPGETSSVDYLGRRVLRYQFKPAANRRVVLEVLSESTLSGIFSEIQHHPTRWPTASSLVAKPPEGTEPIVPEPVTQEIPAGRWVPISDELTIPPGYVRAFLLPRDQDDRPVMVVDPDPEVGQDNRGLVGSAETLFRGLRDRMGPSRPSTDQPTVRQVRCVHCLQPFPEYPLLVRCPPTGNCAAVPDVERNAYIGGQPTNKPVYPLDAANSDGPVLRCPQCHTPGAVQVCPHCHGDLPPHWASHQWIALTFVGAKNTGKTITMTVLQHELRTRVVRALGRTMQPADEFTAARVKEYEDRIYGDGEMLAGTLTAGGNPSVRIPMIFDLGLGRTDTPAALALFDVSGEDMHTEAATAQYAHLLTGSDGLVFLFDPLQLRQVQDKLRGVAPGYFEFPEMATDPAQALRNIVTVIRRHLGQPTGKLAVRLCMTVSKLDGLQAAARAGVPELAEVIAPGSVLMRDPYPMPDAPLFDAGDAELQHRETQALLERLNAIDLLNLLASNFTDYRFFAQSALGHGPIAGRTLSAAGINSYRLADVVRMFLAERRW